MFKHLLEVDFNVEDLTNNLNFFQQNTVGLCPQFIKKNTKWKNLYLTLFLSSLRKPGTSININT